MVTLDAFRKMALALPGAEEQPHFHLASFRVKKKDICHALGKREQGHAEAVIN